MKNVNAIVEKPMVRVLRVGFIINDIIEGILNRKEKKKQKATSVCLENKDYHSTTVSEMHQKFGTLSW
jgi:hypothetical protein